MGVYFFLPLLHFPNTGTVGGLRLVDALEFSLGNATHTRIQWCGFSWVGVVGFP